MFLPAFNNVKPADCVESFQFSFDISSNCQFSLIENEISWLFPDLEDFFPDISWPVATLRFLVGLNGVHSTLTHIHLHCENYPCINSRKVSLATSQLLMNYMLQVPFSQRSAFQGHYQKVHQMHLFLKPKGKETR